MSKKQFLLLKILLAVFFVINFLIYTSAIIEKDLKKYPSVLNFGDVMFDRGVRNIIENRGRDPFEYIKRDIKQIDDFDVIVVNLEGPIVEMDRNKCQLKAYNFQFASTTTKFLKSIGINMVNIANNHIYDCFGVGYAKTKQFLEKSGIEYIGDIELQKSYVIKNIDGKKIAFVGMDETVQIVPLSSFYPIIKKLDLENDFVVVNIHWGTEYELKATNKQITIGRKLIDNGADVVFGHHPHVLEPVEIYKNGVIFYSLGNFVFDQDFGDTTIGIGAGLEFRDGKKVFTILPFNIKIFAPEFMRDKERELFCENYLGNIKHAGCHFEL